VVSDAEPLPISHVESNLPPLLGAASSVEEYVEKLEEVGERLSTFYSDKNRWLERHAMVMDRPHQRRFLPKKFQTGSRD